MSKTKIVAEIFEAVGAAIAATNTAEGKWVATGPAVARHYATRAGFVAVRPEFIFDYIYPNMGKDAVTGRPWTDVMMELPRKGNKDYKLRAAENPEYEKHHAIIRARQKIGRAMGGELCTRVEIAAFGKEEKSAAEPAEQETEQAKLLKIAAALLLRIQKVESPTFNHKDAIKHAQGLVKALTI